MPNNVVFKWVDTVEQLTQFCRHWSTCQWLALDTEFVRERTYYPIPALLQISDGDEHVLIDCVAINNEKNNKADNWIPLIKLFQSQLLWVMHSCSEDIEVLQRLLGTTPGVLFDTQVACNFLGLGQSISYQKLIEHYAHITLDKGATRTDWLKRPLATYQLTYAANDVSYLAQIWQEIEQQLEQKNLKQYFQQDMDILKRWQPVDMELVYQKVKGGSQLSVGEEVNRLQQLALWREQQAQQQDRPRRFVLSDETLIQIAKENPKKPEELAATKLLTDRQYQRYAKGIMSCLEQATKTEVNYPILSTYSQLAKAKPIIKTWKNLAFEIAHQNQLSETVLFSNRLLNGVYLFLTAENKSAPVYWNCWRKQLLEPSFQQILEQQTERD